MHEQRQLINRADIGSVQCIQTEQQYGTLGNLSYGSENLLPHSGIHLCQVQGCLLELPSPQI
jgi:hypothetical protein